MKILKTIDIKGRIVTENERLEMLKVHSYGVSPESIQLPKTNEPIKVVINSTGGDVNSGSEIYTMLKEYKGHVTVDIVGIAASIAGVIAMAGDTVRISPTAQLMIHEVSTTTNGVTSDHKKTISTLEQMNDSIAKVYSNKTGKSLSEIRFMMADSTWLTAQQAYAGRFVDEIMFADKTNNMLMEDYYKNQRLSCE
ncbi:head maturation protease, ClpP-related [Streptococcus pluranimalium]|uniref:head maturation protease, ClpP-related n=1 Tax=Streptococcus pluranimalium TaxID=82348 RepID=UPI003F68DE5C